MGNTVKPGVYRHFKGGIYEVMCISKHSETMEDMVVYRSVDDGKCWVRPLSMWSETVEYGGKTVSRFAYLGTDPKGLNESNKQERSR